jgi:hypothetical protein
MAMSFLHSATPATDPAAAAICRCARSIPLDIRLVSKCHDARS